MISRTWVFFFVFLLPTPRISSPTWGNLQNLNSIAYLQRRRMSKRSKVWNRVFDFKWTVLRTYWELEARTGTQRKLLVSLSHWRTCFCFSESAAFEIETKPIDFGSDFGSISACTFEPDVGLLTGWRKKTRIIENQNYHLLPSLRLLLECVLSKYEGLTPNSKISGARLHPMVEVGSRYSGANPYPKI